MGTVIVPACKHCCIGVRQAEYPALSAGSLRALVPPALRVNQPNAHRPWSQAVGVQILAKPLTSCVTRQVTSSLCVPVLSPEK